MGIEENWEAANGEEALDILAKHTVDVVFSNINMPKMDGIPLLAAMKQEEGWKSIPVLMITTEAPSKAVVEVIKKGAFGYIKKPFTPSQRVQPSDSRNWVVCWQRRISSRLESLARTPGQLQLLLRPALLYTVLIFHAGEKASVTGITNALTLVSNLRNFGNDYFGGIWGAQLLFAAQAQTSSKGLAAAIAASDPCPLQSAIDSAVFG